MGIRRSHGLKDQIRHSVCSFRFGTSRLLGRVRDHFDWALFLGACMLAVVGVVNVMYVTSLFLVRRPDNGYLTLWDGWVYTAASVLPIVLVASPAKGFKSIQDILTAAKASPGRISYASAGVGTSTHLALEKLRLAAGVDFLHVPYKSTTDAMVEVMSGRIDILYTAIATAQGPLREGRLVPFAMIPRKVAMLPDVPAVGDVVPGASLSSWVGVMMSSKVPREIVDRLNREIVKVMNTPDMRERFAKQGTEPWTQSAEAFEAMRKREIVENAQLVKAANIKP